MKLRYIIGLTLLLALVINPFTSFGATESFRDSTINQLNDAKESLFQLQDDLLSEGEVKGVSDTREDELRQAKQALTAKSIDLRFQLLKLKLVVQNLISQISNQEPSFNSLESDVLHLQEVASQVQTLAAPDADPAPALSERKIILLNSDSKVGDVMPTVKELAINSTYLEGYTEQFKALIATLVKFANGGYIEVDNNVNQFDVVLKMTELVKDNLVSEINDSIDIPNGDVYISFDTDTATIGDMVGIDILYPPDTNKLEIETKCNGDDMEIHGKAGLECGEDSTIPASILSSHTDNVQNWDIEITDLDGNQAELQVIATAYDQDRRKIDTGSKEIKINGDVTVTVTNPYDGTSVYQDESIDVRWKLDGQVTEDDADIVLSNKKDGERVIFLDGIDINSENSESVSFSGVDSGRYYLKIDCPYTGRGGCGYEESSNAVEVNVREPTADDLDVKMQPNRGKGTRVGFRADWNKIFDADRYRVTTYREDIYGSAETFFETTNTHALRRNPNAGESQGYCYYFKVTVDALDKGGDVITSNNAAGCYMSREENEPGERPSSFLR
jgi:hypothetical protein